MPGGALGGDGGAAGDGGGITVNGLPHTTKPPPCTVLSAEKYIVSPAAKITPSGPVVPE